MNISPYKVKNAWAGEFYICHGFSCTERTKIMLSEKQWRRVAKIFRKKSKTPEDERKKIAQAIEQIETEIDKVSGLRPDLGEARTFEGDQSQMDCIDESINTSMYLEFLQQEGLMRLHEPVPPVHRGFFVDGKWPHNSGAVRERPTGKIYVIDSYYFDSGKKVYVVPLDAWLKNWRPEEIMEKRKT
jgi:hypothetical protein